MKTEITLRGEFLRAANKLAARNDIRYYLNGVCVEIADEVRYIATNGSAILVLRDRESRGAAARIVVPSAAIEMLSDARGALTLTYDAERPGAECRLGDVMFTPIDGKYPEYRKIFPETVSKEWAAIQPRYLLMFHEAAEIALRNPHIEFWPDGPKGVCLVTCGREEFAGAVMPFNAGCTPEFAQWVQKGAEAVAA